MVKDSDHPSKYFPSNIWRISIRQNFPPSKFCAIRYLFSWMDFNDSLSKSNLSDLGLSCNEKLIEKIQMKKWITFLFALPSRYHQCLIRWRGATKRCTKALLKLRMTKWHHLVSFSTKHITQSSKMHGQPNHPIMWVVIYSCLSACQHDVNTSFMTKHFFKH